MKKRRSIPHYVYRLEVGNQSYLNPAGPRYSVFHYWLRKYLIIVLVESDRGLFVGYELSAGIVWEQRT